jgi:hypothetical protein
LGGGFLGCDDIEHACILLEAQNGSKRVRNVVGTAMLICLPSRKHFVDAV